MEYTGPESPALEQVWDSLTPDQQTEINAYADEVYPEFVVSAFFGDVTEAEAIAASVVSNAHRIAGLA